MRRTWRHCMRYLTTGTVLTTSTGWLLNAKIRLRVLLSDREFSSNVFPTATHLKVFHHELSAATRLMRSLRLDDANSADNHAERRGGRTAHQGYVSATLPVGCGHAPATPALMRSPRSPAGPTQLRKHARFRLPPRVGWRRSRLGWSTLSHSRQTSRC
jgi:hypothetical protein